MADEVLASCVARTSTAILLIMPDKYVFVFHNLSKDFSDLHSLSNEKW